MAQTLVTTVGTAGGRHSTTARERARLVLALTGLCLYWPLLRRNGLFFSLAGHDGTEATAVGWYAAFLALVVIAVFGLHAIVRRSGDASPRGGSASLPAWLAPTVVAVFSAQLVCKLAETLAAPVGIAGAVVALLDTGLYALVFVLLTYAWAAWLVSISARTAVLASLASFGASFVLKQVALLPGSLGVVATASLPLVSCALWFVAGRGDVARHLGAPRREGDHPDTTRPSLAVAAGGGNVTRSRSVILMLATFLVVGGLVRGLVNGTVDGSVQFPPILMDLTSVAFACLALVYCWREGRRGRAARVVWSIIAVAFFAGLLAMPVFGTRQFDAGTQAVIQARTYFELLLWLVLLDGVRRGALTFFQAFGMVFVLVDTISGFIGYVLPYAVASVVGLPGVGMTSSMALLVTMLLIVAYVLILNLPDEATPTGRETMVGGADAGAAGEMPVAGASVVPQTPTEAPAGVARAVGPFASAAPDGGLTPREEHVARLIAEGNTQRRVAELEGITLGTVQSHVKSIYRKLGIHSRQELIDLVHAPGAQGGDARPEAR